MTDHITEKKVESEGKVFNKNRGKTVSKSKVFNIDTSQSYILGWIVSHIPIDFMGEINQKITVTITKHLDNEQQDA